MATDKSIKVRVGADTKHFDVNIKKSTEEVKKFRKEVQGASTTGNFMSKQLQKAATASSALHGPLNGISGRLSAMSTAFRIAGVGAVGLGSALGGLAVGFKAGLTTLIDTEHQLARVEGVLMATGGAAGFTTKAIDEMSREIAMSTLASTEGVRAAAAALGTFTTISGDTFERTLRVSQDLAEVMGTDITGASMQLAKALDAPLLGMNSLRRSGVSFTNEQREMIKELEKSGDLFAQQEIILGAVESQLKGVAEAAASTTFVGAVDTFGQSFSELFESAVKASGVLEVLKESMNKVSRAMQMMRGEIDLSTNSIYSLSGAYRVAYRELEELRKKQEENQSGGSRGGRSGAGRIAQQIRQKEEELAKLEAAIRKKAGELSDEIRAKEEGAAKSVETNNDRKIASYKKLREEMQKTLDKVAQQTSASEVREQGSVSPDAKNDAALQKRLEAMEIEKQAAIEKFGHQEELLRAYQELEIQLLEEHAAKKKEIDEKEAEDRAKYWIKWSDKQRKKQEEEFDAKIAMNDAYVNAVGSSMGTLAGLMEEGSKARQVLLWAERAATLASINLNIYAAMSEALKAPYPENLVAYGQVATLGASLLANVASMGSMGSRASGGPVAPGGRYMVGEHGPEILQMGTGSGTVIKNEDISPKLNVNIVENPDRGGEVQQEGSDVTVYVQAAVAQLNEDLNSGRGLFASVENRYGLKR